MSPRVGRFLRFATRYVVVITLVAWSAVAWADNVATLVDQLTNGGERERLAAAVSLVKLGDAKAILPLIKATQEKNESSEDVRQVAARGLGTLVTGSTGKSLKGLALKTLTEVAGNDPSSAVQAAAKDSLTALGAATPTGPSTSSTGASTLPGATSVYVNISPMAVSGKATVSNKPKVAGMMHDGATGVVAKTAYSVAWPGGKVPTSSDMIAKHVAGFFVDGTLNDVDIKTTGSSATISCKVSMLLAEFPSQAVFGSLSGKASIEGGSSQKDIDYGVQACVQGVVENLITKQILPTIKSKTGIAP